MKLPLAALAVLLALPSWSQEDPNARPKLYPIAAHPRPSAPLKTAEARELSRDLIHGDLNISGLDLFLNRTDVKRTITAEDRAWAEAELAKAMEQGDVLVAAGDAALKAGIEREIPDPRWPRLKHGLMYIGRAKLALSSKPTAAELRRQEIGALCGVLSGLANTVDAAAQPKDEVSEATAAEVERHLAEDRAELADTRAKLGARAAAAHGEKARGVAEGRFAPAPSAGEVSAPKGGAVRKAFDFEALNTPPAATGKRVQKAEPPAP